MGYSEDVKTQSGVASKSGSRAHFKQSAIQRAAIMVRITANRVFHSKYVFYKTKSGICVSHEV